MSHGVARDMDRIWLQPGRGRALVDRRRRAWRDNANFVEWLGRTDLTRDQISDVRRRLNTIDNRLQKQVHFHIHTTLERKCGPTTWAFHTAGRHIHVCPFYFTIPASRFDEQASTIIHELSHGLGFSGRGHPGRANGIGAARKLAQNRPRKARKNPWNFENLYLQYR